MRRGAPSRSEGNEDKESRSKKQRHLPADQEPSSLSLPHIPSDILTCIFKFIPTRSRLRVVALVCKRWKIVARACTSALLVHAGLPYSFPFEEFPSLTNLRLSGEFTADFPATWPTSITALEYSGTMQVNCPAPYLPRLARLCVPSNNSGSLFTALLLRRSSNLTSLSFPAGQLGGSSLPTPISHVLTETYFPSLCALEAGCGFPEQFVQRHATQITSLHISRPGHLPEKFFSMSTPLPALKKLVLLNVRATYARALMLQCTALCALTLLEASIEAVPGSTLSALQKVQLRYRTDGETAAVLREISMKCPNFTALKDVYIPCDSSLFSTAMEYNMARFIRELYLQDLKARENLVVALHECISLKSLTLDRCSFEICHPLPPVMSPRLRRLRCESTWPFEEILQFWREIHRTMPLTLSYVWIPINRVAVSSHEEQLRHLLYAMERRGVREVLLARSFSRGRGSRAVYSQESIAKLCSDFRKRSWIRINEW